MPAVPRARIWSRGRAPRPRAAASAEAPVSPTCVADLAPASPTCMPSSSSVTAGRSPAPSPAASRCTPSGLADLSQRISWQDQLAEDQLAEDQLPALAEDQRSQRISARRGALAAPIPACPAAPEGLLRLAQLLAALQSHLAAQCCGRLVICPQLRQQRLRRRPQLTAGAAQVHGGARLEHVAQLGEEDALLVAAQRRQRHRGARRARSGVKTNDTPWIRRPRNDDAHLGRQQRRLLLHDRWRMHPHDVHP
eukprot:scaffold133788_cov69-Phaeocystis_antarctica.AAC.1